ncbi:hypothetical protein QWY31_11200 [Cytophagales bacterium LB-30]|uniref:Alpha/beta hydrolase n=1 Tax=Shiella aurantiaca TaxID=3058365 RepID=A0ABT8F6H8_9BACT|nr:hypothetical protein [Shiella aurantiaca]MDN4166072.1 hypothetical protein [Shiella aurantiaca]
MRLLLLLFSAILLSAPIAQAQQTPTLYLFPGQGSDKRLFDSLRLDETFPVRHIEYGIPAKGSTMQQFAE